MYYTKSDTIIIAIVLLTMLDKVSGDSKCFSTVVSEESACESKITCYNNIDNLSNFIGDGQCTQDLILNEYDYDDDNTYSPHETAKYKLHIELINVDVESYDLLTNIYEIKHLVVTIKVINGTIVSVPEDIYKLPKVTDVDLNNNKIESINLNKFLMQAHLEKINLSHNSISVIETDIHANINSGINSVITIDLSYNLIESIPDNCFIDFVNLQHLNLSHNFISSFDILTFEGMRQLQTLQLSNNNLLEIGLNFARFVNLVELSLDYNHIASLKELNFKSMSVLRKLNISSNYLNDIELLTFQNLQNLSYLDLSYNQIRVLPNVMFRNNSKLETLDISHNKIDTIELGVFEGKNISKLDIKFNRLASPIVSTTFQGIYVTELDLSGGKITTLGPNAFSVLNHYLCHLNLSSNLISNISKSSFDSLMLLKVLDLSNNNINEVEFVTNALKKLSLLYIRHNTLEKVFKHTFRILSSLTELDLSYNMIKEIEPQSFDNLTELKVLMLNNNPLSNILDSYVFEGLTKITSLNLINVGSITYRNKTFSDMIYLKILNLSHGKLSRIEYNVFRNMTFEVLDLSYNVLDIFSVNTSSIYQLREMYLNNNKIRSITNDTFAGLKYLRKLNLACNNIITIQSKAFNTLTNLIYLNLSTNVDMKINNGNIFDNLTSLSMLSLENNKNEFNFVNALNTSITDVDLPFCNINNIDTVFVYKIKNVYKLNLSWNKIIFIDKFSFRSMPTLVTLDLSHNLISQIQPGSFIRTNMINSLNLYNNKLTSLRFGVLDGLKHLHVLNLSSNAIHSFGANILHNTQYITTISLDDNVIADINFAGFSGRHITLSIGGNPIACDILVALKDRVFNSIVITAERLDYHSENVDGVTCKTDSKHSSLTSQVKNNSDFHATQIFVNLTKAIENLHRSIVNFDSEKVTNLLDSLRTDLKNLSVSIDNFRETYNDSQISTNTYLKRLTDINNDIKLYLYNKIDMYLKNQSEQRKEILDYIKNNVTILFNNLSSENANKFFEHENSMMSELKNILQDIRKGDVDKDYLNLAHNKNDNGEVKGVLYFIAACLSIMLILFIFIVWYSYFKTEYKRLRMNGKQRSSQSVANILEMK